MGLQSFFKRKETAPATQAPPARVRKGATAAAAAEPAEAVLQARTRARQRLIGAIVLLGIGIIGFPLLFETQPRPIPVDIPIDIPKKDGVLPLPMPAPRVGVAPAADPATVPVPSPGTAQPVGASPSPSGAPVITESAADAGRELPAPKVTATSPPTMTVGSSDGSATAGSTTASADAAATPRPAMDKPAGKPAPSKPASANDAARALALLDGKPADAAASSSSRFIVQVGAFSEPSAARDARLKVEKLGLKTYMQSVDTQAGKRIRVRVGPFASHDEAASAASKIKSAGLGSVVLTL